MEQLTFLQQKQPIFRCGIPTWDEQIEDEYPIRFSQDQSIILNKCEE